MEILAGERRYRSVTFRRPSIANAACLEAGEQNMSRATNSLRPPIPTAVLVLLGAIGLPAPPAAAQSQPGRILVDNTGPSILEFNIDGSNGFAIAGNTGNNVVFSPSVAGSGTIAFNSVTAVDGTYLSYRHIFLMNADGTNVRQITPNPPSAPSGYNGELNPAISPDGTMVAFLATLHKAPDGSQNNQIYLVNADGSNLRQLTPYVANPQSNQPVGDYTGSYMDGLAWSPDSSTLAFRGTMYTSVCGTYGGQPIVVNVIGSVKADGTGMQVLACDNNDGYVSSLDWSPDGTLIVWGRNVNHGAQGCSGCVGEPAIAFYDLSGRNRYSAGITSTQLTTDSCQGGPHCIHFSPDGSQLAYVDAYPNHGNPCQSSCNVSFIKLDGSGQTNSTIPTGGNTVWWEPGAALAKPAQMTLASNIPNVPPNPVEVWPGFSEQVIPTLSDSGGDLILHTAQNYVTTHYFYASPCLNIGPFGLAVYNSNAGGSGYGTISAANAGLTSNTVNFNCWSSSPCTFSLGSASTAIADGGGTGTFTVSANPGSSGSTCPWIATTSASWITITSGASGSGNGSVSFSVSNNTGAARQGTIAIAGQTYTVNQAEGAARTGGANPSAGSALNQTLTFTFSDPTGWQNLGIVNVLIDNFLDGRHACFVAFMASGASSGSLYLVDDAGDAGGPYSGMVLPGNGSVQNSQCSVAGAGSSVNGSGNTLTLTLAITFSASFAGNKIVYLAAQDNAGNNSGWQALGTWGVPGPPPAGPAAGGVSPARSSAATQTYTFTFTDTNGFQDLSVLNVLINDFLDGRHACYVAFVPSGATGGSVYLVDDAGDAGGPYSGMLLPGSGAVTNSQCTVNAAGSSVTASGNTLTLTLAVTFNQSFAGDRVIYLAARSNTLNSNWQSLGSVTVP